MSWQQADLETRLLFFDWVLPSIGSFYLAVGFNVDLSFQFVPVAPCSSMKGSI